MVGFASSRRKVVGVGDRVGIWKEVQWYYIDGGRLRNCILGSL